MPDLTQRPPVAFLHYRGDVDMPAGRLGPNTLGEYLYPVTKDYDVEKDQTTIGLSYIAPREGED